jgi:hypothetical protein
MSWIKYSLFFLCLLISASTVAYSKCQNIRNVDFRNRVYPLKEYGFTEKTKWLRVSKGHYEDHSEPTSLSYLYFEISDVVFGDLTGDGKDEAAVVATYGSNSGSFFLTDTYVFGCVAGKVKLVDILKQSRIEKESEMLVHESIKKPAKIRNGSLSVSYGTEGARPTPEFTTTFRYKVSRSNLVAYKSPIRRKNL